MKPETTARLKQAAGRNGYSEDSAEIKPHLEEWRSKYKGNSPLLLKPSATSEVSAILAICNETNTAVVPQGGNTGLVGGQIPFDGEILLSLSRMNQVRAIDAPAQALTVEAGVVLVHAQTAADGAGLYFPLSLAAEGAATIGGNLSTNAGGVNVLRYGMARDLVLGLEVVLADGRVLDLRNKMIKNNCGYDLKQCFIGSEGTLGVITRAVLKLAPQPGQTSTLLCALPDYASAVSLLRRIQRSVGTPQAYELMWQDFFRLGVSWLENTTAPMSLDHPLYVLLESAGSREALEQALADAFDAGEVVDAILASSHTQARGLWKIREATGEFPLRLVPLNFDISLPIGQIGDFAELCRQRLDQRWPGNFSVYFGHIGDSDLHLTVDCRSLPQPAPVLEIEELVYAAVGELGGAVSAEHGIGLLKREFLHHSVSAEALGAMGQLKACFDPNGILNPGKILV